MHDWSNIEPKPMRLAKSCVIGKRAIRYTSPNSELLSANGFASGYGESAPWTPPTRSSKEGSTWQSGDSTSGMPSPRQRK